VTPKEFHDYFSKFGNIISAKLTEDDEGDNIGYGFVLYDSEEGARKAIQEGNNVEWKGKKIFVGKFIKNRPKKPVQFNTIYCKNLEKGLKVDEIKKLFVNYGEVLDIFVKQTDPKLLEVLPENKRKVILDHQFAFITFKEPKAAMRVVDEFPYLKLKNKEYNNELLRVVEILRKAGVVEERHLYRFACYLIENENKEYSNILTDKSRLTTTTESFKKHLIEYDDNYITKDKADRLECFQSLKKEGKIKKIEVVI